MPTPEWITTSPPVSLADWASMGNPNPTRRVVRVVKNGSRAFSTAARFMPRPSSSISTVRRLLRVSSEIRISTAFACAEIESEELWAAIAETDVCKRWWAHMQDVMPSNPDNSPVAEELGEVFHMD